MLMTVHLLPYLLNSLPILSAVSCELPVSEACKMTTFSIGITSSRSCSDPLDSTIFSIGAPGPGQSMTIFKTSPNLFLSTSSSSSSPLVDLASANPTTTGLLVLPNSFKVHQINVETCETYKSYSACSSGLGEPRSGVRVNPGGGGGRFGIPVDAVDSAGGG
jgi:hypothetical protein